MLKCGNIREQKEKRMGFIYFIVGVGVGVILTLVILKALKAAIYPARRRNWEEE